MFKVGDKVRVVKGKSKYLVEGRTYTVHATTGEFLYVKSDDTNNVFDGWRPNRFELVEQDRFKTGDRVQVVEPTQHLPRGEYTVDYIHDEFVYVLDNGATDLVTGGWLPSRFELVEEQDMRRNYPTQLHVGDVMHTPTGRAYTVVAYDRSTGDVKYAYVPWKSTNNIVKIDKRNVEDLHWVSRVTNSEGYKVWVAPSPVTVGDWVEYKDHQWKVVGESNGYLALQRSENLSGIHSDLVRTV